MSRPCQAWIPRCLASLLLMIASAALPSSAASVSWAPAIPDQVFPAAIISLAAIKAKPGNSNVLCDPGGSFRVITIESVRDKGINSIPH